MTLRQAASEEYFDSRWAVLAEQGVCDGLGGAEYRRVKREWLSVGMPRESWAEAAVDAFIQLRANIGPESVAFALQITDKTTLAELQSILASRRMSVRFYPNQVFVGILDSERWHVAHGATLAEAIAAALEKAGG